MHIISGSSNLPFAENLAAELGTHLTPVDIDCFANQERRLHITENLHGKSVVLVQSHSKPVDQNIMETLLLLDALERLGARQVFAVIPWLGYSVQDKVFRQGEPLAAKVVASALSSAYLHRVFLFDLHNASVAGFFSVPTAHLSALELFVAHAKTALDLSNTVAASPDFGGLKRAKEFAKALDLPLANIDKHRDLGTGEVTAEKLHGDVHGKSVLLFDDVILSGSTAVETAGLLKEHGAEKVYFFATHGIFVENSLERLEASPIDQIIITNSIAHQQLPEKVTVLNCASLFAEALRNWL